MLRSLIIIGIGVGLVILGLVLIAVPHSGWEAQSVNNGFEFLKTVNHNIIQAFESKNVPQITKAGMGLAIFAGPIIGSIGVIGFLFYLVNKKIK